MSANPLRRKKPYLHVPLLVLAFLFGFPILWLVLSSLQPREQIGKVPPEWLPRQHYIEGKHGRIAVTPPQKVEGDQVSVREWRLSKYEATPPAQFTVAPGEVRTVVKPVWGNYPEAVRALTAGEKEKSMPLGELVARSRYPWTPDDAEGRTITFLTYVANTLLVALLAVLGTVLSSALVAYGLTRVRWKGRDALFAITLATMMIPFPVLMVPLYSVFRTLGWVGTLLPLWVPAFFGSAFSIFLLRQFFMTIPGELSEAARLDGCSEFQIFWRIVLPLARPALSVVALFHFLFVYNDFLGPLLFLTEPETFTMALGLQQYQSQNGGSEWHLLMAASAMLIAPVIALFFFAQRSFIEGISTTGLKG
jgi:multiple sugar transport system permease protein